jgi:hypothetical protein
METETKDYDEESSHTTSSIHICEKLKYVIIIFDLQKLPSAGKFNILIDVQYIIYSLQVRYSDLFMEHQTTEIEAIYHSSVIVLFELFFITRY